MFNFNFGKKKPDIKQYAIIGIVLSSIIAALSQCSGISTNTLWDLLDEMQRKYFQQTILNEFIIKDPEKLDRRIKRDVDGAIDEYWRKTGEKPVDESVCYTDECKKLGGEMRLCAPWVSGCN